MRACMLAYTFYDADNRVRRYAEALVKRGDEVDAIALARPGQPAIEVIEGVHVFRIQTRLLDEAGPFDYLIKLLLFFSRSAWTLTIRHLRRPYHLIHVHSVPDFEVFATLVPRLMGARIILDIHDIVPEFYASKFKTSAHSPKFRLLVFLERISCFYSNHVIISNHLWKETIIHRSVRPEKCTTIINYPDPAIFWPRQVCNRSAAEFVMCYPGTFSWHQGLDLAIDALALLHDEAPELKLLLVGDGPERRALAGMIERLHLEDRVTMKGFMSLERIAEIMSSVDLGIVPKRADSFGNEAFSTKIMEFMAMSVPVIASRTRIDEYYFNDKMLVFFESGNAEDLATKILRLMRDPARRTVLREESAKFISRNNWLVKKHEYLDLVDRLTGSAGTSTTHADGQKR